jgi:Metallo-beta-lactamase superfamily
METAIPGLYASAPETLPFAPSLDIRAFLLRRDQGNLLIYSVPGLQADSPAIEDLGGVSRQYLNHRHEAGFLPDRLPAPLFVHQSERESVAKRARVRGAFSRRHTFEDDFEVIPTPGHTPGATAYLWDSGEHRFLFTGDTVLINQGEWVAAVLGSSEREPYLDSLELMRELEFDVLVPWAATGGEPYYAVTSRADTRRRIGAIIDRVRRGEDH